MAVEEVPVKAVVELGSFSILNPKPPGGKVAVDGDFSYDSGNAATGAKLFKAKCASCHTIKEGGAPCGTSWVRRGGVASVRAARERRAWCPSTRPHRPPLASLCAQARTCKGQTCTGSWDKWLGRCASPAPRTEACRASHSVPVVSQRPGQKYTKGMKTSGITWDNETMFNWLSNPKSVIKGAAPCRGGGTCAGPAQWPPRCLLRSARLLSRLPPIWHPGTNMAFVGFKKPTDSADVIAFLNKNQ
eukprot:scaffold25122_cov66-Phaeocystis_antarctica.AAC.3